jgi:hypothetical protein
LEFVGASDIREEELDGPETLVDVLGMVDALFNGGRRVDVRIEGLRSRVGGGAGEGCRSLVVDPEDDALSALRRSRFDGEGGGLSAACSPSATSSSKSNIFAKSNPTLGEFTNRFASSAGVGVASGSPVVVKTTPFIAEGINSVGNFITLRLTGVSSDAENSCSRVASCSV